MRKITYSFALAIVALALSSALAMAGGWAVASFDELPTQVVAGEPITFRFVVRQHGVTPTNGFNPIIAARLIETSETVRVVPEQQGPVGHYVASVTFPSPGNWEWSIDMLGRDQQLPSLTVLAAPVANQSQPLPQVNNVPLPQGTNSTSWFPISMTLLGLLGGAGALYSWRRSRRSLALALALFAVVILLAGLALATVQAVPS